MKITWQGHACFVIETSDCLVVTDPYTPEMARLAPIERPADIVIRSSPDDPYHCCESMVPGDHMLVEALDASSSGPFVEKGITFEAFRVEERKRDPSLGLPPHEPRDNAIYLMEIDGLGMLHLGDLGVPLPEEHAARLRHRVDILLAPTGDRTTIALQDLHVAIAALEPRLVIPMHYQIREIKFPYGLWLYPVEAFVNGFDEEIVVWNGHPDLEVSATTLPLSFQIVVLEALGARVPSAA